MPPLVEGEWEIVPAVCLVLVSDQASFVNGVAVNVDGGQKKPVLSRMLYGGKG